MTDTNPTYRRLTKQLSGTRKTLTQACIDAGVDIEDVDDYLLEQWCRECSHCGIWGTDHKTDTDDFPVCRICFGLVGR
jgi:hypothetical protein